MFKFAMFCHVDNFDSIELVFLGLNSNMRSSALDYFWTNTNMVAEIDVTFWGVDLREIRREKLEVNGLIRGSMCHLYTQLIRASPGCSVIIFYGNPNMICNLFNIFTFLDIFFSTAIDIGEQTHVMCTLFK